MRWSGAATQWHADRLATLYANDALLFGGRSGHAVGRAAIRAYFASYEGMILGAQLKLTEQECRLVHGATYYAQGYAEFAFVLAGGKSTRSRLRSTLLIDDSSAAPILAHHFSPEPETPPLGN